MPLFLARWPAGWVTLVKAASEDDALFILDEDADTTGVTVTRYRGPFVIDFAVDAKYDVAESADQGEPLPPTAISVIDAGALEYPSTSLKPQIPEGPTAEQMLARIVRLGFPAVAKVQRRRRKPKPGELEAALREDLQSVVSTSWRHASLARRVEKINRRATQTGQLPADVSEELYGPYDPERRAEIRPFRSPSSGPKRRGKKPRERS